MATNTLQPPELFNSKPWGFSQVVITEPGRIVNISGQVAWGLTESPMPKDLKDNCGKY